MSILSYKKLFELELKHDFYADGNCPDFTVIPSEETLSLLSRLKIRTINTDKGLILLYEERNGTPVSPITEDVRFSFGLKLNTPNFTNFTELAIKNSTTEKYYYYTEGDDPFTQEQKLVYSKLINYEFSLNATDSNSGQPVTVVVRKGSKEFIFNNIESYGDSGGNYFYRAQLDLKDTTSGIHVIFHQIEEGDENELDTILVDGSLSNSQIFGIVDIYKENNGAPDKYTIQFKSKKVQWKYFLVLKNGDDALESYEVIDTKETSPIEFELTTSISSADLLVIDSIKQQYPNAEIKIYRSPDSPALIPFSETSRKGIALKKEATTIIHDLPNPNPKSAKPEMFVYVDN